MARLAGLTQAGLLHHFSSKEELFLAVLQQRDDRLDNPDEPRHTHSVGRLISAVERNVDEPGLVRLFVSMSAESVESNGPARSFFEDRYRWLRGELHADVTYRQAHGELAQDLDPDDVASLLNGVRPEIRLDAGATLFCPIVADVAMSMVVGTGSDVT